MEIGLRTFAETTPEPGTGRTITPAERLRRRIEEVEPADRVIEKILAEHRLFGHQRFLAQLTVGAMPHDKVLRAIELLGTKVAPAVRRATAAVAH